MVNISPFWGVSSIMAPTGILLNIILYSGKSGLRAEFSGDKEALKRGESMLMNHCNQGLCKYSWRDFAVHGSAVAARAGYPIKNLD